MLKKFIFLLLTFSLVFCACPNGMLEYQSNCYYFNATKTGFAAAEISCENLGGYLVSIHDRFVNVLLGEEAQNYFLESTVTDFWIGANDFDSNGKWSWTDGTPFDFNDWQKGEPQNTTGSNCVALSMADGYWSAQDCFKLKPFVCKTASTQNYPIYQNCSSGWFYFAPTHSCYGMTMKGYSANWTAAEAYCRKLDASLSSLNSFAEFQLYTTFLLATSNGMWTNVFSVDSGKTWKTVDGSPADFMKYGNWCEGFPTKTGGQRCVVVGWDGLNGCYKDFDCDVTVKNTLCKKTLT